MELTTTERIEVKKVELLIISNKITKLLLQVSFESPVESIIILNQIKELQKEEKTILDELMLLN